MPAFEREILSLNSEKIKLLKWKVRKGSMVYKGSVLALYSVETDDTNAPVCKLKADEDGTVVQLVAEEGEIIKAKEVLLKVQSQSDQGCTHPTIMKDMCANCGADLRKENGISGDRKKSVTASVAMVHSIPELIVSQEQALELGKEDENRLLRQKKLVLLVDLDQTLIHTTNDQIPSNLKDVKHFQLWDGRGFMWYHTRFRPYTQRFMEAVSKMYELHICTFGVRMYAHTIARLLDPEEKYFSHRILSRDECFDSLSKTANLKALFPCGDKMVGIIDDREDVWNFAPNLVHVKPYRFFQGTADINAPPGLTKAENDNVPIVHKTVGNKVKDQSSTEEDSSKGAHSKLNEASKEDDVNESGDVDEKASEDIAVSKNDTEDNDNAEGATEESKHEDVMKDLDHSKEISQMETEDSEKALSADNNDVLKYTDNELNADAESVLDKESEDNPEKVKELEESGEKEKENVLKEEEGSTKCDEEYKETAKSDQNENVKEANDEIEWEDMDDYLLHLEEILTRIHQAYYNMHEQSVQGGSNELPDLKSIIPYVKKKVLKGANIVFSGMFPLNMPAERSRAYVTAKALGANVQMDIVPSRSKKSMSPEATTHLLAAKAGTGKYKTALKAKGVSVVSGDWLWACAERWEWVDERLFLMAGKKDSDNSLVEGKEKKNKKNLKRKNKAMSNESDDVFPDREGKDKDDDDLAPVKKSKSKSRVAKKGAEEGEFASSYNPLLSFSNEDIEFMDKEVDEMMEEDGNDSDESDEERNERMRKNVLSQSSDSDSDSDSLAGDFPRGWKMRRKSLSPEHKNPYFEEGIKDQEDDDNETENELERYQKTVDAFAPQESDQDSDNSGDSIGSVDEEIAAAVEKEFLGAL